MVKRDVRATEGSRFEMHKYTRNKIGRGGDAEKKKRKVKLLDDFVPIVFEWMNVKCELKEKWF